MARYNKEIVEQICSLISQDSYTIAEICKIVGIAKDTYYRWLSTKTDFSDAIKKAESEFNSVVVVEAKRSLMRLIKGYTATEEKSVMVDTGKVAEGGEPIVKVKQRITTEKHYQPNPTAIIFALTNRDPDNWKNRQSTESSVGVTIGNELESMTDEQLEAIIKGEV